MNEHDKRRIPWIALTAVKERVLSGIPLPRDAIYRLIGVTERANSHQEAIELMAEELYQMEIPYFDALVAAANTERAAE